MKDGGRLRVRVRHSHQNARTAVGVTIADNGAGIPPEAAARIFFNPSSPRNIGIWYRPRPLVLSRHRPETRKLDPPPQANTHQSRYIFSVPLTGAASDAGAARAS